MNKTPIKFTKDASVHFDCIKIIEHDNQEDQIIQFINNGLVIAELNKVFDSNNEVFVICGIQGEISL